VRLLAVLDRLVGGVDLGFHHLQDFLRFVAGGGQYRQRVEGSGKARLTVGRGAAVGDRAIRDSVEVATQGDDLAVGQGQTVGQVQFDLPGRNGRCVLGKTQLGAVADGGVFAAFEACLGLALERAVERRWLVILEGVMTFGEKDHRRAIARNGDTLFGEEAVQFGNDLAVVQQEILRVLWSG